MTTFYEFLAYNTFPNPRSMMDLEKTIVENNIVNMPPAGLKNFIRAQVKFGSASPETLNPIIDLLTEKKAYNDLKVNLQTIRCLTDTLHRFDDYMLHSLEAYKKEFDNQKARGNLAIETSKKIDRSATNFFMISHFTVGNIFKIVTDYAFIHGINFTEEQVSEFAEKMPIVEEEGKRTITGTPETIEEHIYYQIIQNGLILGRETSRANALLSQSLITLESSSPALFNSIPELATAKETILSNFLEKANNRSRKAGFIARKVQESLEKAGVTTEFDYSMSPFGSLYLFDKTNKVAYDYFLPSSFIKTPEGRKLRLSYVLRNNYLNDQGISRRELTVRHFKVNEKNDERFD